MSNVTNLKNPCCTISANWKYEATEGIALFIFVAYTLWVNFGDTYSFFVTIVTFFLIFECLYQAWCCARVLVLIKMLWYQKPITGSVFTVPYLCPEKETKNRTNRGGYLGISEIKDVYGEIYVINRILGINSAFMPVQLLCASWSYM